MSENQNRELEKFIPQICTSCLGISVLFYQLFFASPLSYPSRTSYDDWDTIRGSFPWHFHLSKIPYIQKFRPQFYRGKNLIPWRKMTFGTTERTPFFSKKKVVSSPKKLKGRG